jgi:hypothetical protein
MFELFFFTPNQNIHEEDVDDGENESHRRSKERRRSKKDENIHAEICASASSGSRGIPHPIAKSFAVPCGTTPKTGHATVERSIKP